MATLVLVISFLVGWYAFSRRQGYARDGLSESVAAKLCEHVVEWTVSLSIVLLFYHVLLLLLAFGWQSITVKDLERIEGWLSAAQRLANLYKPTWGMWLATLIALYLLGRVSITFLGRNTPFGIFRKIKSALHVANTILFLLGSFTLLGFERGEAATTLEIHLQHERKEYGILRKEVQNALAGAAINDLYNNTTKKLRNDTTMGDLVDLSVDEGAKLQVAYYLASTKYGFHDSKIEQLITENAERQAAINLATGTAYAATAPKTSETRQDYETVFDKTVTAKEIARARESVTVLNVRLNPRLLRLISRPGGEDLLFELPEGGIDRLTEALDPIGEAYPVLRPVFDVLKSMLSDAFEIALKRNVDTLMKSVIDRPESIDRLLPEAAKAIADATPVHVTPEIQLQFRRNIDELQGQVAGLRDSTRQAERAARTAKARQEEILAAEAAKVELPVPDSIGHELDLTDPAMFDRANSRRQMGRKGTGCTCDHYKGEVYIGSVQIAVGAACGDSICGQ